MIKYAQRLEYAKASDNLFAVLSGPKKYKKYREVLAQYNIQNDYYEFRFGVCLRIVIEFLKENNIQFEINEVQQKLIDRVSEFEI